ncbi:MAG: hypothetical protein A2X11_02120 [Bacteroidetes bacterium GWE2_42_24]|nr:MAG: hypothetical protein A2X11_02120 [Bacteroidetes bacterium GWE2_42_24]OFY29075.1 MAG: hypothetical protein A2X09_16070 [Bacteroidetes bacterium GWF2_43_11]
MSLVSVGQNVAISPIIQKENGAEVYLHTVQRGETLYRIAKAYQVSVDDIVKLNPTTQSGIKPLQEIKIPKKADINNQQQTDKGVGFVYHIVRQGETLEAISLIYNIDSKSLLLYNTGVIIPLQKDQILKIPMDFPENGSESVNKSQKTENNGIHIVKPKETLFAISRLYGLSIIDLLTMNPKAENGLKVGDTLKVLLPERVDGAKDMLMDNPDNRQNELDSKEEIKQDNGEGSDSLYEVRKKETWYGIARQHGLTVSELRELNPGKSSLSPGMLIVVKRPKESVAQENKGVYQVQSETAPEVPLVKEPVVEKSFRKKTDVFKVALLMPFGLKNSDTAFEVNEKYSKSQLHQFRFLSFYEGLLIAADSLRQAGLSLELYTFDVPKESNELQSVLQNPVLKEVDLIIGLVYAGDFIKLSKFSAQHQIPLINPLTRRRESATENEWVIKIQPDASTQLSAIQDYLKHTAEKHDIIISRQNKYQFSQEVKDISNMIFRLKSETPRVVGSSHTLIDSIARLKRIIRESNNPVIFSLSENPAYVMDYLRKLNQGKDSLHIFALFGLPDWNAMDKLETSHLDQLNVHMLKAFHPSYQHYSVGNFVNNYKLKYYADPDELAFTGFDVLWISGQAIQNSSDGLIGYLKEHSIQGILADYHFKSVGGKGIENQFWNIYRIDDFKIKVVNR